MHLALNTKDKTKIGGVDIMVKEKSIAVCIILSLVTCGIYDLIWIIALADDINTASLDTENNEKKTSGGLVLLFSILTCGIYYLYWLYKSGDRLDIVRESFNRSIGNLGILYLILGLFGFGLISQALIQNELNEYARRDKEKAEVY